MTIKLIKSNQDLENALKRISELSGISEPNTQDGEELIILIQLIEDYELASIASQRANQEEIEVNIDDL